MTAKYVDLRPYGQNMTFEKARITEFAKRCGLEVVIGGRDGVVLHGDSLMIAALLRAYPVDRAEENGDLEDDL